MEKSDSLFYSFVSSSAGASLACFFGHPWLAAIEADLLLWKRAIPVFVRLFFRPLAHHWLDVMAHSVLAAIEADLLLWK